VRPQIEMLKNHADFGTHRPGIAANFGCAGGLRYGPAVDADGAFGRLLQQREAAQQRGFPGPSLGASESEIPRSTSTAPKRLPSRSASIKADKACLLTPERQKEFAMDL